LSGDVLTFTGTGAVKVRASQSGNADFLAAVPVERTITVAANPSTLTLANLSQTYTGTPRPITVLGAVGEVDVTYKVGSSYVSDAPINVGSYAVKAVAGSITKTGTLVITQAPLFVQPYDQRKFAGQVNPALGFSYSGFLGGAASVMWSVYNNTISFQMGFRAGMDAFTAAVLGGIGSMPGAMLGGILIGLIRALSDQYIETQWTNVVVFGVLILILVFRPSGLLGLKQREKV
jgi:hypothetical protein